MECRQLDFTDFDAVVADVQRLHEQGYHQVGQWSLSQILQHLTLTLERSVNGFPAKMPWFVRKIVAPLIRGKIFAQRKLQAGLKAPVDMVFSAGADEANEVKRFNEVLDRVKEYQGEFQPHPVFEKISPEEWRQFHFIHIAHHLNFLIPK